MATNHRLFVEPGLFADKTGSAIGIAEPAAGPQMLTLPDEASHYLTRVLRLRTGARLTVFNGDGYNYAATLIGEDKRSAQIKIESSAPGPAASPQLNLAIALLKGDKLDFALQKATELDVSTIWLTQTSRCELRLSEKRLANRLNHWRRIIVSACEQSGRTLIPTLNPPQPLSEILSLTADMDRYSLEPSAPAGELKVAGSQVCLFTGPEGGFDDDEIGLLAKNSRSLQLGELVLRAETAPLVGLSLLGASRRAQRQQ